MTETITIDPARLADEIEGSGLMWVAEEYFADDDDTDPKRMEYRACESLIVKALRYLSGTESNAR
jgi:hypothetical protein